MAEDRTLPGWPRKSLVKQTKQCLWRYFRSRPTQFDECWRAAWEWAKAIAERNLMFQFGKSRRAKWPQGNEIATQYLLLSLARMKGDHNLRLPFRSDQCVTPRAAAILGGRIAKLQFDLDEVTQRLKHGDEPKFLEGPLSMPATS